ncbi:MAG: hypothetical protein H6733_06480 [Alphaproteobacteria bacterium]|nr:hypothetical protein [Alphaproteobacteria bacterium]
MRLTTSLFSLAVALGGCGAIGLTPGSETDPGQACFDEELADDGAWVVTIDNVCWSGSYVDPELTCEVTLDGDAITITATSTFKSPPAVTDDCRLATTTCTLPTLADGTYEVTYRGRTTTIVLGDTEILTGICLP